MFNFNLLCHLSNIMMMRCLEMIGWIGCSGRIRFCFLSGWISYSVHFLLNFIVGLCHHLLGWWRKSVAWMVLCSCNCLAVMMSPACCGSSPGCHALVVIRFSLSRRTSSENWFRHFQWLKIHHFSFHSCYCLLSHLLSIANSEYFWAHFPKPLSSIYMPDPT